MAEATQEIKLSKMQNVRKRELRRAIQALHEARRLATGHDTVYGLSVAITVLGEMRKEIDEEKFDG